MFKPRQWSEFGPLAIPVQFTEPIRIGLSYFRGTVGMEASGHARWFERLLSELQFELWIGDAAEIRTKRVRKQKTDHQDAQLLLKLMVEDRSFNECTQLCAHILLDMADIVRDGDFSPTSILATNI